MIYLASLRDMALNVALWAAERVDRTICRWPSVTHLPLNQEDR